MTDFDAIYAAGGWNGMGSGPGSTPGFTKEFRRRLKAILVTKDIGSVFEPGCGDWQWQQLVDWGNCSYIGADIVESVIAENAKRFPHLFARADVFAIDNWPLTDLMIVKDLIHHLTHAQASDLYNRSWAYDYVLWVVDMDGDKICNWPADIPADHLDLLYDFDLTVENYPYGRKAAFLQVNK